MNSEMPRPSVIRVTVLWLAVLLCLASIAQHTNAQQEVKPNPLDQYKPHGYVNDFAGIIDPQIQSKLELICKDLDKTKRTQMTIVTVVTLDGRPIKEFATELANRWGVGYKDNNRGILILLSQRDRQYRLAVGFGLESVLTDEEADHLGREMVPLLKKEDYGNAILHLATRIHDEVQQKVK
jgi:uncharacterized protein